MRCVVFCEFIFRGINPQLLSWGRDWSVRRGSIGLVKEPSKCTKHPSILAQSRSVSRPPVSRSFGVNGAELGVWFHDDGLCFCQINSLVLLKSNSWSRNSHFPIEYRSF